MTLFTFVCHFCFSIVMDAIKPSRIQKDYFALLWWCRMMIKEEEVRLKLIRISCCRLVSAVVNGHRLGFGYLRFCSTILRYDTKIELTVRKGHSNNKHDHYYILYIFSCSIPARLVATRTCMSLPCACTWPHQARVRVALPCTCARICHARRPS